MILENHPFFMQQALEQAQIAFDLGEVPIGAILVTGSDVISRAHNTREKSRNPLHHAEMLVLEEAARQKGSWRLESSTLYVTLEPCPMCLGALLQARVGTLVYGCSDQKRKTIESDNEISRGGYYSPEFHAGKNNLIVGPKGPSFFRYKESHWFFPTLNQIQQISGNNHTVKISGGIMQQECSNILKQFFKNRRIKTN